MKRTDDMLNMSIDRQFTDEQKNEISELYVSGKTQEEIASEFSVSRRTIMKLCKCLGLHKSNSQAQKSRLDLVFVEKVIELRKLGKTIPEIARITDRSISAVGRICAKQQLEKPTIQFDDIKTEYESGCTISDLASKYKTNSWMITKKLDELEVKRRPSLLIPPPGSRDQKRPIPQLPPFIDSKEWFEQSYIQYRCSLTQIAEYTNRSIGYVSSKLSKYGIQLRSISEGVRRLDPIMVLAAYKELNSMSKVAEAFNCTITAVSNILANNGVLPTSVSEMFSSTGNPFYGKQHSDEVKQRCAQIGDLYGKKFWVDNPEYIEIVREKQKLLWSDLERRKNDSILISQLRKDGKLKPKSGILKTRFGDMLFDSSWEAVLIETCANDGRIKLMERDFDLIEYEHNGVRHFVPDFRIWLTNGEFFVVEIKNNWLAIQPKEQAKIAAAYNVLMDKFMVVDNNLNEVIDRIGLLLSPSEFSFDSIEIREVIPNDYSRFYSLFHYKGRTGRHGFTLGAYLAGKLIAVATISSISRQESAERLNLAPSEVRELVRFCIHPDFHKKNFGSWFLSRVVNKYVSENITIKTLISFADTTQGHVGTLYKASGWIYDGNTKVSYHYKDLQGFIIHKKTVYDRAKAIGVNETTYANEAGYRKISELPKMRFILQCPVKNDRTAR